MKYRFGSISVEAEIRGKPDNKINSLQDVENRYGELGDEQKEHLYAVFLTKGNEEIGDKLIGLGGLDSTPVDVPDVVRTAVLVNAGAVILVHNHPSGKAEATQRDIESTEEIHGTLERLGISLLDHVIITRTSSYSMKYHGDGPFSSKPLDLQERTG